MPIPLGSILRCGKKKEGAGERKEEGKRERGKEQKEESNRLCLTWKLIIQFVDIKMPLPVLITNICKTHIVFSFYSDAGRDWGQEEKGTTEDETAGWHH